MAAKVGKKTAINPPNVWKPEDYFNIYLQPGLERTPAERAGWAQGARKGDFVFISGQTPTRPDGTTVAKDMHAQLRQALVNFKNVVEAEGGTLEDVVQIRYYFHAGYMEEGLAALRDIGSEFWSTRIRRRPAWKLSESPGLTTCSRSREWLFSANKVRERAGWMLG